jgi:hypothetical protein
MAAEDWVILCRLLELRGTDLKGHAVEDHNLQSLAESWGTMIDKLESLPAMSKDTWERLVKLKVSDTGHQGAAGSLAKTGAWLLLFGRVHWTWHGICSGLGRVFP